MPGLDLKRDGVNWPHRDASREIQAGGLRWHVQEKTSDKVDALKVLLLHGTGASTHSFAGLMDEMSAGHHLLAMDLPGHGFTQAPPSAMMSLPGMASLVAKLCEECGFQPDVIIGHSAGAAIGLHMILQGMVQPKAIISLAGALIPIGGSNSGLFSLAAKMLWLNPFVPRVFAWRAGKPEVVAELLGRTGSQVEGQGLICYQRLARDPGHAAAALGMMANWDLNALNRSLPKLEVPLLLIGAEKDGMIPASDCETIKKRVSGAESIVLEGVGHLAHEEDPATVAQLIRDFLARVGA